MHNRNKIVSAVLAFALLISAIPFVSFGQQTATVGRSETVGKVFELTKWKVAPSGDISAASEAVGLIPASTGNNDASVARKNYNTNGWLEIPVPGSLIGGLVSSHVYDSFFAPNNEGVIDVMFDDNLTKVPNDFASPWWYSTNVSLTAAEAEGFANIQFKGINYTGEVYINGTKVENKNISITSEDELRNRTVMIEGTETDMRGVDKNPDPIANGGYIYTDPAGTSIPAASTVSRGEWDEYSKMYQGSFRQYDVDATGLLTEGANNIKVKVTGGDRSNDFNYNFHDWHPAPVGNDMGITNPVTLTITGAVRLSNPFATAKVDTSLSYADVTFSVDANNPSDDAVTGRVNATVKNPAGQTVKTFGKNVTIPANSYCYEVLFSEQEFRGADLQLWWPYLSGDQPLYHVTYEFVAGGQTSDSITHRFGIREFTAEVNRYNNSASATGGYMMQVFVNHKPIVIKGGGYCPTDLYLRQDAQTDQKIVDVIKSMGFNAIRDEGKFFNDNLIDLLDENGILFMTGYMCCDRNETSNLPWAKAERFIVYEQTYNQLRSLRTHPCFFMWLNGSDNSKDASNQANGNAANITHKMMEIEGRLRFYDHGIIMSIATYSNSYLTGAPGGLEMDHVYDTQMPTWYYAAYSDTGTPAGYNGMFGFVSEGFGGAAIPTTEGIKRQIPTENLWPINVGGNDSPGNYNKWMYHANRGGSNFTKIDTFVAYSDNSFGGASNLDEWVMQSQVWEYDQYRAMYEALNVRRFAIASGLINWMLNGPRPSIMWNQFDFDMNPHGASYGAAKANEPVHIMYNVYDRDVSVVNSTFKDYGGMTATLQVYDITGRKISDKLSKPVYVGPDGIGGYDAGTTVDRTVGLTPKQVNGDDWYEKGFDLYKYTYGTTGEGGRHITSSNGVTALWSKQDIIDAITVPTSDVYFLRLELSDSAGKVVSHNSYVVPRKQDVWTQSGSWNRDGEAQSMDYTQLKSLPAIAMDTELAVSVGGYSKSADGKYIDQTVTLTNNSASTIAYGIELKAFAGSAASSLLPSTYDDNLITLYPGESRVITVTHMTALYDGAATIKVNCFNNMISNRPGREGNIYIPADPDGQTAAGTTDTTPDATTNLARNRQYAIGGVNNGELLVLSNNVGRATSLAANSITQANKEGTVIDHDYSRYNTTLANGSLIPATGTLAEATGWFYVDLGDVKPFDRAMVRWTTAAGTNMISGVPDFVTVEVTNDPEGDWTLVPVFNSLGGSGEFAATYDNSGSRASMTNIIFVKPVTARYVRFTLQGLTSASTIYGNGPGTISSQTTPARAASANFQLNGVEVYRSFNYAYINIADDGAKVTVNGGAELTSDDDAYDRAAKVYADEKLIITVKPANPASPAYIFKGAEDLSPLLVKDAEAGTYTLTLDGLDKAADFTVTLAAPVYHTVTFDPNGGAMDVSNLTQQVADNGVAAPPEITKEGSTFKGWYLDGAPYDFTTPVTEPIRLTAAWKLTDKSWGVNFYSEGEVYAAAEVEDTELVAAPAEDPASAHGEFVGWVDAEGDEFDFDTPITGDVNLYAKYDYVSYTITFDVNGGSPAIAPAQVKYAALITEPQAPAREGFTFDGWYVIVDEIAVMWDFATDTTPGNMTLIAGWAADNPSESAPESSQPESSAPETSESASVTPESSAPASVNPESSAPASVNPESSAPASVNPESSNPASVTPASSTPASVTPASSAPASVTPESSNPASVTPASSNPASVTPASSNPASVTPASSVPAYIPPASAPADNYVPVVPVPPASTAAQPSEQAAAASVAASAAAAAAPSAEPAEPADPEEPAAPGEPADTAGSYTGGDTGTASAGGGTYTDPAAPENAGSSSAAATGAADSGYNPATPGVPPAGYVPDVSIAHPVSNNGRSFLVVEEPDGIVYIFDADGLPLGYVKLSAGQTLDDIDILASILPLGTAKPNPRTGATAGGGYAAVPAIIGAALIANIVYGERKRRAGK